jgi:hypothetical protein
MEKLVIYSMGICLLRLYLLLDEEEYKSVLE